MKKRILLSMFLAPLVLFAQELKTPYDYVNPFIGTGGHVHTYPGATLPFGAIQLSPDTDIKGWDWCSGYHYSDSSLLGFSHTHLSGTGWSDLGDILLIPTVGELKLNPGEKSKPGSGYRSRFSHTDEVATPGYYSVLLKDYGVKAELTCTQRVGFHRYTFPEGIQSNVIIDPTNKIFGKTIETSVNIGKNEITGYCLSDGWGGRRYVYFVATFSKPFASAGVSVNNATVPNEQQAKGIDAKAWARFNTKKNESIEVNVSLSAVSLEGARKNMLAEAVSKNFDQVRDEAKTNWENKLNKIIVEGGNENDKAIFYTGLYHCYLAPTLSMDVDGKYVAVGKTLEAKGFTNYSTWSHWDTHRAAHPLFTILEQKTTADFANSLISRYTDAKDHMPIWELCGYDNTCMIGYHSASVIWDAIAKGVKGINLRNAFNAMKDASVTEKISSSDGSGGIQEYIKQGYVPCNIDKSVSKTLEYAYDDWCIAQLAAKLGLKDEEANYRKRAASFENIFNPEKKAFYPKYADGRWHEDLVMNDWNSLLPHYISGNFWDYEYYLPHATNRLVELKGGKKAFENSLDTLFNTELKMVGEQHVDISGFFGKYAHGDEPGHNIPYLYNYTDSPWKTQALVNKIRREFYFNDPVAMPNNEDCGQMSAWYVLSSLGFYPMCPGKPEYSIGTPLFKKASIKLENGKTFIIEARNLSDKNIYVARKTLNGKPLTSWTLKQTDLMNGGRLLFEMSNKTGKLAGK
jgi:predicted alpha-1,2-mannosidase